MHVDRFEPDYSRLEILFTLALGISLGVALAGLWLLLRGTRTNRLPGLGLLAAGVAGGLATGAMALDAGPFTPVSFRIKPYAASLAEAGSLALALLAGAGLSLAAVMASRRVIGKPWAVLPALAVCVLAVGLVLSRVDYREYQRHPDGTDTSRTVEATRLIDGLDSPVGLAIAPNGELAVVELLSARLRLYSPKDGGFSPLVEARLPMADDALGFHVTFHPDYPSQPYLYATATDVREGKHVLVLVRGRVNASGITFDTLIDDLPAADITRGNHYGSGIAICQGFFFLSTGDTEVTDVLGPRSPADSLRHLAQDISDPRGKIFRWRLDGAELVNAPLLATELPLYAFGFRNPFGMTCDEATGYPIVAENGENGYDQVRIVPPGTNHEWPLNDRRDSLVKPLLSSKEAHLGPSGVAQRSTANGYELVVSTFEAQAVYLLTVSAQGVPGRPRLLVDVEGGSFGVTMDASGCAYFSSSDAIWRIDDGPCSP